MRHRTTVVLLALFSVGLAALWWAGDNLPTAEERREVADRLLPSLRNVPTDDVRRLEIVDPGQTPPARLVVERRDGGAWQIVEPVDAAADPGLVETLTRNLQNLRKSSDSGTIEGDPAPYGLDAPKAVVSVFGRDPKAPLAVLEIGKTVRDRVYVRPRAEPTPGVEVVDTRLLSALSLPVSGWRDRAAFRMPSFKVAGLSIKETGPAREVEVRRDERRWKMVKPVRTPADDDRAEGLVAELAALRVEDGPAGFVADSPRGLAEYGLDAPSATITLTPFGTDPKPQTLFLGKDVPDKPGFAYARRGDQDDVVRLDVSRFRKAYPGPTALRSTSVADFDPAAATHVRVESLALGKVFDLARTAERWELRSPSNEQADSAEVQTLVTKLAGLKTSEFFDPAAVPDAKLDPPAYRVRVWKAERGSPPPAPRSSDAEPEGTLCLDLRLGKNDAMKKTIYGRLDGDPSVLAIPNTFVDVLPRTEFAYRDRTAVSFEPARLSRLTVERGDKTVTVEAPGSNTAATRWKVVEPVVAPADETTVTALVVALSQLHVDRWESGQVGDGKAFGFDAPRLRVRWTTAPQAATPDAPKSPTSRPVTRTLRVGKATTSKGSFYANVEGDPRVFSLSEAVVAGFGAELHDPVVLKVAAAKVSKVVLRWPTRTLSVVRSQAVASGWVPELGYDPSGFDLARVGPFVDALAGVKTPNYFQYKGPLPDETGLKTPRLTVQLFTQSGTPPLELKIGRPLAGDQSLATTAAGPDGPVFAFPTPAAVADLIAVPPRAGDLPADVFAPPAKPRG